jgi:hypothetical protein
MNNTMCAGGFCVSIPSQFWPPRPPFPPFTYDTNLLIGRAAGSGNANINCCNGQGAGGFPTPEMCSAKYTPASFNMEAIMFCLDPNYVG